MSALMPDNSFLVITPHAAERWRERIDPKAPEGKAVPHAEANLSGAFEIPRILMRRFYPAAIFSRSMRFYGTSRAVFIVCSNRVISVFPFSEEGVACVLVWVLTESFPADFPCWIDDFRLSLKR